DDAALSCLARLFSYAIDLLLPHLSAVADLCATIIAMTDKDVIIIRSRRDEAFILLKDILMKRWTVEACGEKTIDRLANRLIKDTQLEKDDREREYLFDLIAIIARKKADGPRGPHSWPQLALLIRLLEQAQEHRPLSHRECFRSSWQGSIPVHQQIHQEVHGR
ncbi:hypothetical protein PENTCL1PPCAC_1594, partial [Pristionchus entomophagus]